MKIFNVNRVIKQDLSKNNKEIFQEFDVYYKFSIKNKFREFIQLKYDLLAVRIVFLIHIKRL